MQRKTKPPRRMLPEYLQDDWKLPLKRTTHDLMLYNAFDWRLLPVMDDKWRKILFKCTSCTKKEYKQSWPVSWTTLVQYHENVHNVSLDEMRSRALNNEAQDVDKKERTTNFVKIDNVLTKILGHENRKRKHSKTTGLESVDLNKEQHLELSLSMIVANNLSFSLVYSKSFRRYLLFLRGDMLLVNRLVLRRTLTKLYQEKTESINDKFVGNTGCFSITIDKWNSSNNIEFLGITLHFYNNEFELKKYTIGFEISNENLSYTRRVVFESLMKVLCDCGIQKKKITAITRDNAGPINVMMKKFIDYWCPNTIDFHGDI